MNTINYMERTRDLYRAQGFEKDYVWAHFDDIPFSTLQRPLSEARVTIVTTAVVEPEIPKPVRAAKSYPMATPPETFSTDELAWDKVSTHTDDVGSYFPLAALKALQKTKKFAALTDHYHFVPTEYSQRNTLQNDAPAILQQCLKDHTDIAILVPL